jgi:hypothetical protein
LRGDLGVAVDVEEAWQDGVVEELGDCLAGVPGACQQAEAYSTVTRGSLCVSASK